MSRAPWKPREEPHDLTRTPISDRALNLIAEQMDADRELVADLQAGINHALALWRRRTLAVRQGWGLVIDGEIRPLERRSKPLAARIAEKRNAAEGGNPTAA